MHLRILVPSAVFLDARGATRVLVQTTNGLLGLQPQQPDCTERVAASILSYQVAGGNEVSLAVDKGVLIKSGSEVLIAVGHVVSGDSIEQLHAIVMRGFPGDNADTFDRSRFRKRIISQKQA